MVELDSLLSLLWRQEIAESDETSDLAAIALGTVVPCSRGKSILPRIGLPYPLHHFPGPIDVLFFPSRDRLLSAAPPWIVGPDVLGLKFDYFMMIILSSAAFDAFYITPGMVVFLTLSALIED